ncbi:MAG TPA: hypothetical protein PLD25_20790 [Chloroflexota bacterium]|nr:hypothetical protein [Chloroflexota bacterium]HUM67967.1 hypothetical protein [Chloroflexota bacterium]
MGEKEPKTGKDFVNLARKSDKVRAIREGKGSHVIIEFDDGSSISVPVHGNKQLSKGIHQKLLKTFKSAGILD